MSRGDILLAMLGEPGSPKIGVLTVTTADAGGIDVIAAADVPAGHVVVVVSGVIQFSSASASVRLRDTAGTVSYTPTFTNSANGASEVTLPPFVCTVPGEGIEAVTGGTSPIAAIMLTFFTRPQ